MPPHPELEWEQRYLDRAYFLLGEMEVRAAEAVADAAERAPGDWDATVAHRFLSRRLGSLSASAGPLCFGRIDEEGVDGHRWHIGRRHVEDGASDAVVVDWRAPVAVPFYRATYRDPLGLRLRRRLLVDGPQIADIVDEAFDDPDSSSLAAAAGLPDPLLAELGRARSGTMRDIVATIATEQDHIIRASLDTPVVVQGGPGTGKTAVGLHRAAWLLYEHRQRLEREGVLVLGPNPVFLSYIAQVLPSLGEVAVSQTTLAGLASTWRMTATDPAPVAALKGEERMAALVSRAAELACRPPAEGRSIATPWGAVTLSADALAELLADALRSGGTLEHRRSRFRRAVARLVRQGVSDRRAEPIDIDEVTRVLNAQAGVQALLQRAWPAQSPASLVRGLLGRRTMLEVAGDGLLDSAERALLARRPAASVAAEAWTSADLALLDEARAVLSGVPRRYGHIVVDEAQDLSHMELRMVARRSADGRSYTILGDVAQATSPGASRSWASTIHALGSPPGASVERLTTGYRVPRPIMELANRLLASVAPDLEPTGSVRESDLMPVIERLEPGTGSAAAVDRARALIRTYTSVAMIAPAGRLPAIRAAAVSAGLTLVGSQQASAPGQLAALPPELAKGLEFDAVLVVEPAEILAGPGGGGLLYIALTRAVQALTILSEGELPPELTGVREN